MSFSLHCTGQGTGKWPLAAWVCFSWPSHPLLSLSVSALPPLVPDFPVCRMGEITGTVSWRTAWRTDNAESWYTKEKPKEHHRTSTRGLKEGQRASWGAGPGGDG